MREWPASEEKEPLWTTSSETTRSEPLHVRLPHGKSAKRVMKSFSPVL